MSNVFIACPTHDGRIDFRTARSLYETASQKHRVANGVSQSSALVFNMNRMFSQALNLREKHGLTWFAMLHSDIEPEHWWLDKMIEIAERNGADMLSAVVPFKDNSGLTSTAIEHPGTDRFPYMRLTMRQVLDKGFPKTFNTKMAIQALTNREGNSFTPLLNPDLLTPGVDAPNANLLVNTGCMVMRIDQPWVEELSFYNVDRMHRDEATGELGPYFEPEDWNFSRQVSQAGHVMATTEVKVTHIGGGMYPNNSIWGDNIDKHCPDSIKH
jgi:hypothetical protein